MLPTQTSIHISPHIQPSLSPIHISLNYTQLFRFSTFSQKIILFIGSLAAIANGAIIPLYGFYSANLFGTFNTLNKSILVQKAQKIIIYFAYIGIGTILSSWIMFSCWIITASRQSIRLKKQYLSALLKQKINWYDLHNQNQITTTFFENINAFQQGISQKIPLLISLVSMGIIALIICLTFAWQLTLFVMALLPLTVFFSTIFGYFTRLKKQSNEQNGNKISAKTEQVISFVKTIKCLNGQQFETQKFQILQKQIKSINLKYSIYHGIGISGLVFSIFITYGLTFLFAQYLLENKIYSYASQYDLVKIFTVINCIFWSAQKLNRLQGCLKKIALAKIAAVRSYEIIDSKDGQSKTYGIILQNIQGQIKFQNVSFSYPNNSQKIVLKNLNLQIRPKSTNIFVGQSGCGKSTIFQLILRFYDNYQGKITLDGIDIKQLNIHWLRKNISYVSQDSIFFSGTIKQNLLIAKPDAIDDQIIQALHKSNSYDFVMNLQNKLETILPWNAPNLSGGQKQRLSITRAILQKCKIVLFDEATSALDRDNQRCILQNIRNKIFCGVFLMISHNINMMIKDGIIIVLRNGRIQQKGKFEQLEYFKKKNLHKHQTADSQLQQELFGKNQIIYNQKLPNSIRQKLLIFNINQFQLYTRLFLIVYSNIKLLLFNFIFSILDSIHFPLFGLLLAKIIKSIVEIQINHNSTNSTTICLLYIPLAFYVLITTSFHIYSIQLLALNSTEILRKKCFNKILKMPISWFQKQENHPTLLKNKISYDCENASRICSNGLSIIIQIICTFIFSLICSLIYDWRISLISFSCMPLMILGIYIQIRFSMNIRQASLVESEQQSKLIMQCFHNIRIIYSFCLQGKILNEFQKYQKQILIQKQKKAHKIGLLFGVSLLIHNSIIGFLIYACTLIIRDYNVDYQDVLISRNVVVFTALLFSFCVQYFPNLNQSEKSGQRVLQLLNQIDQDQIQQKQSQKLQIKQFKKNIKFNNVKFKYPYRSQYIYQNLNITIDKGSKIVFVGASGCGKSTIFQILMKFYPIQQGQILIDDININNIQIHHLRSLFGIVNQQSILLNQSIQQNIIYNSKKLTSQQIKKMIKSVNLSSFSEKQISQFKVGIKGSHISGGQRQRVCIIRTLIRQPKILLLDEGTNGLDVQNERLIDRLINERKQMTKIIISHRIQSIEQWDKMYVFEKGRIIEQIEYNNQKKKRQILKNWGK